MRIDKRVLYGRTIVLIEVVVADISIQTYTNITHTSAFVYVKAKWNT